jgi:hypothetical protein
MLAYAQMQCLPPNELAGTNQARSNACDGLLASPLCPKEMNFDAPRKIEATFHRSVNYSIKFQLYHGTILDTVLALQGGKLRQASFRAIDRPTGQNPLEDHGRVARRPHAMKPKPRHKANQKKAKAILRLPDLEFAKSAVLDSLTSTDAQRGYRHAIDEFVDWYCSEPRLAFNRIVVLRYRSYLEARKLASGTINLRLGAVRRLAYEAADCGLLSTDLASGIRRVKGVKKLGVRLGNWLTADQGHALWQAPDSQRMKGKRDRALLAVLLACGPPAM